MECTSRAFEMIPDLPEDARILDIGCGKGEQTLTLAGICEKCTIVALDIYEPYLDVLEKKAIEENLSGRIRTVCGSMNELPFTEESFDLIWAESSVFVLGLSNALRYWKEFLKPDGYMVISDAVWFTDNHSEEAVQFWKDEYPDMKTETENIRIIESEGYSLIGMFRIPESVWWKSYYNHLEGCLGDLKEEFKGNKEAEQIILISEKEMEIFRNYSGEYGMTFFIIKK